MSDQNLIEREIAAYLAGIDRAVAEGSFAKPPTMEQRVKGAWGHLSLICEDVDIDDVAVVVNSIESMKAHGVDVVADTPLVPVGPLTKPLTTIDTPAAETEPTPLDGDTLALLLATSAHDGSFNGKPS